jgi:hypothetical protein
MLCVQFWSHVTGGSTSDEERRLLESSRESEISYDPALIRLSLQDIRWF